MTTNFGGDATASRPLGTNVTPREGIVSEPLALQGLTDIFSKAGSIILGAEKEKAEGRKNAEIARFTERQTMLAEGIDQGKFRSLGHARALSRQNFLEAMDRGILTPKELMELQRSITGTAGVGKVIADGSEEMQRQQALTDSLVQSGMLPVNHSEEEKNQAELNMRQQARAKQTYDARMDEIRLSGAERTEKDALIADAANEFVSNSAIPQYSRLTNVYNDILNSEMSQAAQVEEIEKEYAQWYIETTEALTDAKPALRAALMPLFERQRDISIKRATGEFNTAETERQIKEAQLVVKATLMADPEIARTVVMSDMFGGDALLAGAVQTNNTKFVKKLFEFIAGGTADSETEMPTIFPKDDASKKALVGTLDQITRGLTQGTPEQQEFSANWIKSFMETARRDGLRLADDPILGRPVADWVASPSFLKAYRANPEAFGDIEVFSEMLKTNYLEEVDGVISREFLNKKIGVSAPGGIIPEGSPKFRVASDTIEAVPTSSGMTFKPIDPQDSFSVAQAAKLNRELKPIINRNIQATAHLAGREDYGALWEESLPTILAERFEGDFAGGDEGDDLEMSDLSSKKSKVDQNYIVEGVVARGLPQHVAEGFAMNVRDESGFDAGINEIEPLVKGSRGGFGLYQLTGPRRKAYEKWAEENNYPLDSADAQLDFFIKELETTEKATYRALQNTSTPEEAAVIILEKFLRPHPDNVAKRKREYTK